MPARQSGIEEAVVTNNERGPMSVTRRTRVLPSPCRSGAGRVGATRTTAMARRARPAQPAANSARRIFAAATIEASLPAATSRGKYFMPQSGARITRSLAT